MIVKWKKTGLTLIEILIVLGIIALFVGLLIPALSVVRNTAKKAKQKAQFSAIDIALMTFKNDFGDYPPSDGYFYEPLSSGYYLDYGGTQKLAEALLGWDLLGFHPKTDWQAAGVAYDDPDLNNRKSPYLDTETANAFRLGDPGDPLRKGTGLFANMDNGESPITLAPDTNVLCDVFSVKKIKLLNGTTVSAGTPILYYKANTSSKSLQETENLRGDGIYDHRDMALLVGMRSLVDNDRPWGDRQPHLIEDPAFFYEYIRDPKITARPWPYRPDSYILISAGADGLYGTGDDIRNFGN
jgi:type II secretory pathway pseudopilin PulG